MQQTEIHYRITDAGDIQIVKIKNVFTKKEIIDKFGYAVLERYSSEAPYYFNNKIIMGRRWNWEVHKLAPGKICDKDVFAEIITAMKTAEKRFVKIRKEVKKEKPAIKKILI